MRTTAILLLAALLFLLSLMLGHHNATAASIGQPINLEPALSTLAGRPIQVTVNTELPGSWGGGAWPGLPQIQIGRDAYTDAQHGGGHGLIVLLHELGHTTGIENEAAANCYALSHLIGFMGNWDVSDRWLHTESRAYTTAVGAMRAQSSVYQCPSV